MAAGSAAEACWPAHGPGMLHAARPGVDCNACPLPSLQAHEALRRAEEQAAAEEAAGIGGQHRQERAPYYEPRERERWDCESVLRWGCRPG